MTLKFVTTVTESHKTKEPRAYQGQARDALIRMGLLRAEMRDNRRAVTEALYDHLDRTLGLVR